MQCSLHYTQSMSFVYSPTRHCSLQSANEQDTLLKEGLEEEEEECTLTGLLTGPEGSQL